MKLREDVEKLRRILLEQGAQDWGQLMEKTGWSPSVLKDRIDFMEHRGELTTKIGKRRGRRKTLYLLTNLEKSRAESVKYDAIEFIQNLRKPAYKFIFTKDRKVTVSTFVAPVEEHEYAKMKKGLDDVEVLSRWLLRAYRSMLTGRLRTGQKIAVIITAEK